MRKKALMGIVVCLLVVALTVPAVSADNDVSDSMDFDLAAPLDYTSSSGDEGGDEYDVSSSLSFDLAAPLDYTASNSAPVISNPHPANNSVDVSNSTSLKVWVQDDENDTLVIEFYNASDDSLYNDTTQSDTVDGTWATYNGLEESIWAENTTYEWYVVVDDGDGGTDPVTSPTWNFTTAAGGESANVAPAANFTYSADGRTVEFTDTSTDSDGTIASYAWEFGDGQTATVASPTHVYTADGTYTVNLTVTDDDGATNTTSTSVTVTEGGGGTVVSDSETLTYVVIIAVVALAVVAMVLMSRRRR